MWAFKSLHDKETFCEKVFWPGTSYDQRRRRRSVGKIISLLLEMPGYLLLTPLASLPFRDDVTRDDSQQRFLAQHRVATYGCDINSDGCNIVPTLQCCVAQKIVVANRPV